jgi:hypothetical protein
MDPAVRRRLRFVFDEEITRARSDGRPKII